MLSSPALAGRIAALPVTECESGALLFESGAPCTSLPILVSGCAAVYGNDETGQRVLLYRLHPGEICPVSLATLLQQGRYPASASAEGCVRVRWLPDDTFRSVVMRDPALFGIFMETFADCLRDVTNAVKQP